MCGIQLGVDFEQARKSDDDKEKWREEPIGMMIKLHRTTDDGVKFATYELWRTEPGTIGAPVTT